VSGVWDGRVIWEKLKGEFGMARNKKLVAVLLGVTFILGAFCVSGAFAKTLKIKVAGISPLEYRGTKSIMAVKEYVEAKTDGRIELDVFPMNQLGDYTQVFEEIRRGTIEMGLIFLPSQFDKLLELGSLPYLGSSYEQIAEQLSPGSYLYETVDTSLDKLGVKLLRLYGDGFIGIGARKMPKDPANPEVDKDMLIRVAPVAAYKLCGEGMGFRTTTIPYADTYSAIQTGVCDGWLGGSSVINYQVFGDVIKYYLPYNSLFDQTAFMMNKKLWESISPEDQAILMEAINLEADKSFVDCQAEDAEYIEKMREKGIEIVEFTPEEIAKIAEHVRSTAWPELAEIYGQEVMQKIEESLQ
jgi:TRAP-type C4-dicarboxylate transport system substrate-binding protein